MPDVIFSGGENSKPLNLAQVDLVFLNDDNSLDIAYDKVKISRRIYRNGENEYKINGKKVRLKDIRELFLDTGVGKEGYSVIGQGRIDEIINSTPKERRAIFEEASGISKHKYRRDESLKKLEKVSENHKVIEREWEYKKKELDTLKVQKDNFDKNKKLSEELDKKAYFYYNKKSHKLIEKFENIEFLIKKIEIEKLEKNNIFNKLNRELLPFKEEISKYEESLHFTLDNISNLEKLIEKNKSKNELNRQELTYKRKDFDRNIEDKSSNQDKILKLEKKIKEDIKKFRITENELSKLKKTVEEKKNLVKTLNETIESSEIKIKNLSFEKSVLDKKVYEYDLNEHTNIILSKQREENERKIKEKIQSLDNQLLAINEKILNLENISERIEEKLKDSEDRLFEKKKNLDNSLSSNNKLKENLNINNIKLKEDIANYKIQKDLLLRNEGYFYSVQEFLKETKNEGLEEFYIDTLANIINVKNGYEDVIETLMSSSLQNIVTRNKKETKQLINLINRKKLGRITFLPLDSINSSRKNSPNEDEVIAMAYDLVKYNPSLENIINHFLGSTVVVKNIDDAISLSKKIRGYKIITLDLDIINTWGSMVAGKNSNKKNNVGIINRSKRIEEIKRRVVFLKEKNKELTNLIDKNEIRIKEEKKSLNLLEKETIEDKEKAQNINVEIKHKIFEKNSLEKRKREELNLLEEKPEEKSLEDIVFIRKKLESIHQKIEDLESTLNIDKERLITTNSEIIKIKNEIEIYDRDKTLLSNYISENKTNLNNVLDSQKFAEKIFISLEQEIQKLEIDNKHITNKIEKDQVTLTKKIEEKEKLERLIEEKIKSNYEIVEQSKYLEKELTNLDLELLKEKYKKESLEKDINNLEDEIGPFLSLSLEDLNKKYSNEEFIEVNKKDLIQLQKEINLVGFFEKNTIDIYEEAYKEFNFLDNQKKDLEVSKEDIETMIKKLESEMKEEFIKNFKIIDEKFQRIFQTLFMGGKAKLSLDEDDQLQAGIEIMACPPGKSSKSISLLSGGEKSLTAVALLFALFETNPAPFSLLDEIDAALDESNIKRYIEYLKSLSANTQFVMITHRQTTMQLAERIHGVTIGEDGISKVYSIDFEEN